MFEKRVIIGGLPRAGTTLFRYILDASNAFISGPETAFFTQPLSVHQNRIARTAPRLAAILDLPEHAVEHAILHSRTTFDAFDSLMAAYADAAGVHKTGWAEKTPFNCSMYHALALEADESTYFVSLIRDGRDVLTSMIEGRGTYHVTPQRYVETLRFVYGFSHSRHLIVRYEDMVAEPEACFHNVFNFLDLPFDPEALTRYQQPSATRAAEKVNQPKVKGSISTAWVGRWAAPEHEARRRELHADPRIAAWLTRTGYEPTLTPHPSEKRTSTPV